MKPLAKDYIDLSILNDKVLEDLFIELIPAVQNKAVLNGLKQAGQIILDQAKMNFEFNKKNKSKTNYSDITKSFKMEPMRSQFGLIVGVRNYKLHWIEWGTYERSYKTGVKRSIWRRTTDKSGGHRTGKLEPTNFFFNAVDEKKEAAMGMVGLTIVNSLNKTVEKYNR